MPLPKKYSNFVYEIHGGSEKYIKIVGFDNHTNTPVVPEYIDNLPVKVIGDRAFMNSTIISIELPNTLEAIEYSAFSSCIKLKELSIPDSVHNIKGGLCFFCSSLKSVKWPKNMYYIPSSAFHFCVSLENISNMGPIEHIYSFAFFATKFKHIELPTTVTIIDEFAFGSCEYLKNITLISDSSVFTIDTKAFAGSKNVRLNCGNNETLKRWAFVHNIPFEENKLNTFLNNISGKNITNVKGDE